MNLANEIAVDILTRLESDGYLKADTRFKNPALLPTIAGLIDARLKSTREEFAKFCIWWAEIGHAAHRPEISEPPYQHPDFWHCPQPMCSSLVQTIHDLARELQTTPDAIASLP